MTPTSVPAARLCAAIHAIEAGTCAVAVHMGRMIRLEDDGEIVGQWDEREIDEAAGALERYARGEPIDVDQAEETLAAFEEAVTEALAGQIECTYSDASGLVDLHADLVEAGFEERSSAAEIAGEIDAQSRVGGVA